MKEGTLLACLGVCAMLVCHASAAADTNARPGELTLTDDWRVTQDVRDLGERLGWYESAFVTPALREWYDHLRYNPTAAPATRATGTWRASSAGASGMVDPGPDSSCATRPDKS